MQKQAGFLPSELRTTFQELEGKSYLGRASEIGKARERGPRLELKQGWRQKGLRQGLSESWRNLKQWIRSLPRGQLLDSSRESRANWGRGLLRGTLSRML